MNRRKFIFGAAAGLTAGFSGALILANAFNPPALKEQIPEILLPDGETTTKEAWTYHSLDAQKTGEIAHQMHKVGSCMYGSFGSILTQLAETYGEPYASFPHYMMKYGASGIGGYGSVCGALNGAAAITGLFVQNKTHQQALIEEIFTWYENAALPLFIPKESNDTMTTSVSNSVLCHISTAKWVKRSGHKIDSEERSERCHRITADVAQKTVSLLNHYFDGRYEASPKINKETAGCVQCHDKKGKLGNIKGKMECASCHDSSLAHTLFADIHYKLMD